MAGEHFIPTPPHTLSPSFEPFFIGKVPIFPKNNPTYAEKLKQSTHKVTSVFVEDKVTTKSIETKLTLLSKGFLQLKPLASHLGKRSVIFQKSDKANLIARLNYVLIAKFSHGRPAIDSVHQFLLQSKIKGEYVMSVFDLKHIFIEFVLYEDFSRIWLKKSWTIKGFPVRFFKWSADFMSNKESPIVPVWVHLPRLPLYLFEEESLLSIANAIGKPLHIDKNNLNRTKLGYASFCVEMDVSKPPLDALWIEFQDECPSVRPDVFCQTIVYGELPRFCVGCQHLGHKVEDCKRRAEGKAADHGLWGADHGLVEKGEHIPHVQLFGNVEACNGNKGLPATGWHAPESAGWENDTGKAAATTSHDLREPVKAREQDVGDPPAAGVNAADESFAEGEQSAEDKSAIAAGKMTEGELSRDAAGMIPEELGNAGVEPSASATELVKKVQRVTHEAPETVSAVPLALVTDRPNSAGFLALVRDSVSLREGADEQGRLNLYADMAVMLGTAAGLHLGTKVAAIEQAAREAPAGGNSEPAVLVKEEHRVVEASDEPNVNGTDRLDSGGGQELQRGSLYTEVLVSAESVEESAAELGADSDSELAGTTTHSSDLMFEQVEAIKGKKQVDDMLVNSLVQDAEMENSQIEIAGKKGIKAGNWADLVEEEHEQQLAREHNDILEWDAAQVRAFVHNQIEEIKQEIGQTEPQIRDAEVAKPFDTSLPFDFAPKFSDDEGNTVTWTELTRSRFKILATRSLSPVGRSSEKLSKLRTKVEHLKCEEKTAIIFDKEYYKEYEDRINEDLRQQLSAFKEQRKASSTKNSTEIVTQEKITETSQVDEQDWTPVPRRGRNRNRKNSSED